jgi:hypothetical protein
LFHGLLLSGNFTLYLGVRALSDKSKCASIAAA